MFASYDHSEVNTVRPVVSRLRADGHQIAFLGLLWGAQDFPQNDGPTFRCRDLDREISTHTNHDEIHESVRRLLPDSFDQHLKTQLISTALKIHERFESSFPLQVDNWVPHWRLFIESTFRLWKPELVVLSPGQIESAIVRRVCAAFRIPCIYFLTPFFEFKTIEKIPSLSQFLQFDEYCVASSYGQSKLVDAGIPVDKISVTGAPLFDYLPTPRFEQQPAPGLEILCTLQGHPDNERLNDRLFRYIRHRPAARLSLRFHPSTSDNERLALQAKLKQNGLGKTVAISDRDSLLSADLAKATVVVTISSMSLCEALQMNVPVISWHPSFMPHELPISNDSRFQIVRTSSELTSSLDRISRIKASAPQDHAKIDVLRDSGQKAADRVCDRIVSRITNNQQYSPIV